MSNYDDINRGFDLLLDVMAPFTARELMRKYGEEDWWQKGVLGVLYESQTRNLSASTGLMDRVKSLDVVACLNLMRVPDNWNGVFRQCLPRAARSWIEELVEARNNTAHRGMSDLPNDDAWRALDTMARLAESFDAGVDGQGGNAVKAREVAEEIRESLRDSREKVAVEAAKAAAARAAKAAQTAGSSSVASSSVISAVPADASNSALASAAMTVRAEGLPSWRAVMLPNSDVMQGRYSKAEFAADLDKVAKNEAELEYQDPVEFFSRTYVTQGMKGLLVQALKRVCDQGGEPVIQLKTAFGGGKTHSMLALYHLLRGRAPIEKIEHLRPVLEEAGVSELPQVHVAVIVGTVPDPTSRRRPVELPGVQVGTLWGEIAAQLAISAGRPDLYEYVRDADRRGVAPGSAALTELFDDCGPCLILIDELVAYARKLWKKDDDKLPAGTFGNLLTFVQEITEAAKNSKNSLVVASIPESDNEIGGEGGRVALESIEHTFGRVESIWQPVTHNEGFEVVRRRLFKGCIDPAARDRVCQAFSDYYKLNADDFPTEARELEYLRRMKSCYPIHPEVFDRLYEDWATLEKFQRTRGVLRLMAGVIYRLWMVNDPSPMIMPGSLPLAVTDVSDELIRYLPESAAWNSIVSSEVDGEGSVPYQVDKNTPRFGNCMAGRRSARAIMLGSAPRTANQAARGIEKPRVLLGVAQPGEYVATFNDAIGELARKLNYLNTDSSGRRFWYDTSPNLRKTVEDRARQTANDEARLLIEKRLGKVRRPAQLAGVHVAPANSANVLDEQSLRLVILPYGSYHQKATNGENPAIACAREILENRGNSPRAWRNTLVFLAADHVMVSQMVDVAKHVLAWESIKDGADELNLTQRQVREAATGLQQSSSELDQAIGSAYCWLLVPSIDRAAGTMQVEWNVQKLNGTLLDEQLSGAMSRLMGDGDIIASWSARLLANDLRLLWGEADAIEVKKLWEQLCRYCYLPRLTGYDVLQSALLEGVASDAGLFALASGVRADGSFSDLRFKQSVMGVGPSDLVVRPEAAQKQIEAEAKAVVPQPAPSDGTQLPRPSRPPTTSSWPSTTPPDTKPSKPTAQLDPTHFTMRAPIEAARVTRNVHNVVEEILEHVVGVAGASVRISIDVELDAPGGIPASTVRTLRENCRNLGISDVEFYG